MPPKAYAEPKWNLPEGVKSVEVNGYDMAYWEFGSGPPVVLVHGSVNDYRVWNSQVTEFSKKYHVIALSLRHYFPEMWDGHGDDYSIELARCRRGSVHHKIEISEKFIWWATLEVARLYLTSQKSIQDDQDLDLANFEAGSNSLFAGYARKPKIRKEGRQGRDTLARNLASGNIELAAQVFIRFAWRARYVGKANIGSEADCPGQCRDCIKKRRSASHDLR